MMKRGMRGCTHLVLAVVLGFGFTVGGTPGAAESERGDLCGYPEMAALARVTGRTLMADVPIPYQAPPADDQFSIRRNDDWDTVTAHLEATGAHCYVYVEEGSSWDKASDLSDAFDAEIYDRETTLFGSPPNVDSDDRIYILVADIDPAGYFHPIDQDPGSDHSNAKDLIYLNDSVAWALTENQHIRAVAAHEFQHLIHYARDQQEELWLNEGVSMWTEFDIYGCHHWTVDTFTEHPDTALVFTGLAQDDTTTAAQYGGAYLFALYLSDHFGGAGVISELVQDVAQGIASVEDHLPQGTSFRDVFESWAMANYLDSSTIDGRYEYRSIDVHVEPSWDNWLSPLIPIGGQPVKISDPSPVSGWAADYVRVHFLSAGFHLKTSFDGDDNTGFSVLALHDNNEFPFSLTVNGQDVRLYRDIPQWATVVDVVVIRNGANGTGSYEIEVVEVDDREFAIGMALQWLQGQQLANGSWSNSVGESAMAVLGFLNAGYEEGSSIVDAGISYILSKRNADGSFDNQKTYETSLALVVLSATHNPEYADEIDDAKDFLLADCWDEGEGYDRNDWYYGGYGYGSDQRPDLSNTQFAAIALYEAGVPADHAIWDKIELFTTRCQNRPASNEQAFAHNTGLPSYDDGGFIYYPGVSMVWNCVSTGTMTAAGIWTLRLCGVPVGDARIQAALQWVLDHEDCSFDETPNQGAGYVSNYIWSVAKALVLCYVDELACGYWYPNLVAAMEACQSENGSWSLSLGTLVDTCFSLLALQSAQPIQSTHWMRVILASHADLHVYDPQGRHLGLDYDTGQMESEIPGASFTTDAQGRQLVDLPELEAGRYRIELVGTGDGEYSLTVTGYDDQDEISSETVQGTISTTGTHVVDVVVSSLIGALTIFVEEPRPVPSGLFSVPGDAQVSLYWDEYAADGFELARYNVYRSEAPGGPYGPLAPGPGLETRYQDNNVHNDTTYYYVVTASSTAETETEYSWEVAATPSASGGSPLVRNGGFEEGLAGWRTTGGTAVFGFGETNPREGTRCALGEETAAGNLGRLYQDVTERVTPGQYYRISGWMKRADTTGATIFGLDYVDESGWTPGGGFVRAVGFVDGGGTSDWTYFESDAFVLPEMPDDCEALWVLVDFNACTGAVWVDGIELRQLGNCGAVDMTVAPAGWHMISLPGTLCAPCTWTDGVVCGDLVCALGDDIDPFYAFRYDADLRSYARVPPPDQVCYQPGMGIWVYTWEPDTEIDSEVTALTGNVELALQNGWNQVGNPYTFAVGTGSVRVRCGAEELSLIDAQAQGWITALLYGYEAGAYVEIDPTSGCLPTWTACWLRAYRADCTLVFQPVGCTSSLTQARRLSATEVRALELPPPPPLNPQAFDIKEVLAGLAATNIPNPIRSEHTTVFSVEGARADMVDEMRVDIYDQSGQRVFTQVIVAKELAWCTVNDAGELLANGVYLYQVWVRIGGIWYPMEIRKLAVVR